MTQHRPPPKKMAGLSWTAVTLSLLLYVGNCSAQLKGPDKNQLVSGIVNGILNKYISSFRIKKDGSYPMFSVAVSIPYDNNKKYDVSGVTDSPLEVKATLLKCKVYKSERMVAATVLKWPDVLNQCPKELVPQTKLLGCGKESVTWNTFERECPDALNTFKPDHAEYRTLTDFNTLTNLNKNDFMLFYVLSSPCVSKCTDTNNNWNILESIKEIMKWNNYAVVFTSVFMAGGDQADEEQRKEALVRLGESIGLNNIFRCGKKFCSSCSIQENQQPQVNPKCYKVPAEITAKYTTTPNPGASGGGKGVGVALGNKGKMTNEGDGVSSNVDGRRPLAT